MAHDVRVWERPQPGVPYALGGDPAQGLQHGDDSVLQVINCHTGEQVAEVQGKIEPLTLAELAFALGNWYNGALVGIENNQDGGANRHLFKLGYGNVYFEQKDTGKAFDDATPRLGLWMSAPVKARLVAWVRRLMLAGDLVPRSSELVAQFEIFVLDGINFQAIRGGHDDLVMAWLIAAEMMRVQMMYEEARQNLLVPLVNGKPIDSTSEEEITRDDFKPRSEKIIEKVLERRRAPLNQSTVGDLV